MKPYLSSIWSRRDRTVVSRAFTLIELLVVVGILAILSAMLLPALSRTTPISKTAACTANFRHWTVAANLYAKDNLEWLPTFDPAGGGTYARDVGTNLCNALGSYGMDVPGWFCPMRPIEMEQANSWARANLGHPLQTVDDLTGFFRNSFPGELILNNNYWVPRAQGTTFPTDYSTVGQVIWPTYIKNGQPTSALYGWPRKLSDTAAAYVPFVSDLAGSGQVSGLNSPQPGSPEVTNIAPNTAHFFGGTLIGVNAAYADGRVESHAPSKIRAVFGTGGGTYWFY